VCSILFLEEYVVAPLWLVFLSDLQHFKFFVELDYIEKNLAKITFDFIIFRVFKLETSPFKERITLLFELLQ